MQFLLTLILYLGTLFLGFFLNQTTLANTEVPLGKRAYIIGSELYEPSKIYASEKLDLKEKSVIKDPLVGLELQVPRKKAKTKLKLLAAPKKVPLAPISAGKSQVVGRLLEPQIAFERKTPQPSLGFKPLEIDMLERSNNTVSQFRPSR